MLGLFALGLVTAGTGLAATATPVMPNLNNPRGIAFGKDGALYVAEAGRGGTGPCQTLRGETQCYGSSGRISRFWNGRQDAVVHGLPSYANATGNDATGPQDLALHGSHAVVTLGWGENPALRQTAPSNVWGQLGRLLRAELKGKGKWKLGTDISAYEAAANPDGGAVDTNPYGILGLKAGPDGALYVGELTGAPFCAGVANVYRVVPGRAPTCTAAASRRSSTWLSARTETSTWRSIRTAPSSSACPATWSALALVVRRRPSRRR